MPNLRQVSQRSMPSCARFKGVHQLYKSGKHSVLTAGRPSSESRTTEHVGWEVEKKGPQEKKIRREVIGFAGPLVCQTLQEQLRGLLPRLDWYPW
jgi:hypothetical protein